jgi:hypothetical protein
VSADQITVSPQGPARTHQERFDANVAAICQHCGIKDIKFQVITRSPILYYFFQALWSLYDFIIQIQIIEIFNMNLMGAEFAENIPWFWREYDCPCPPQDHSQRQTNGKNLFCERGGSNHQ